MRVSGPGARPRKSPVEARTVTPLDAPTPEGEDAAHQALWLRVDGALPDDPKLHVAMLVYMSDRGLMGALHRVHRTRFGGYMGASLDHAIWFHRTPRLHDWVLYDCRSPTSHGGRGICFGTLYDRASGHSIATVAQEALIRKLRS